MGQSAWIRLLAPVSTYSAHPGDRVEGVLTRDLVCDGSTLLPMGTPVEGSVVARRKVGWGIDHETATLELAFTQATPDGGAPTPFPARVEEVVNAREQVRRGVIQGVLASETFQGRISSRLVHLPTWNPYSDAALLVFKTLFPIFPEPEIYLPTGTDLRVRTTADLQAPAPSPAVLAAFDSLTESDSDLGAAASDTSDLNEPDTPEMDEWVDTLPTRVLANRTSREPDADYINLAFTGTPDALTSAFHAAGYVGADRISTSSVVKNVYALLNNSSYPTAPMRTFYLDGRPEDMKWQRSLDSYGRRDHLRIWHWTLRQPGESVWLSSSTHDSDATLSVRHHRFIHHIDADLDAERAQIISDLAFAGCVRSVTYVPRAKVPTFTRNAVGDPMHTDGALAVVHLQACSARPQPSPSLLYASYRPGNHAFRFCRREILTLRSDLLRANIIYGSYTAGRMAYNSIRHPQVPVSAALPAFH